MGLPKWNDPNLKAGTMVRTALWLVGEVGVGNVFTKDQHRQAFAGVTQADRRLRDLRKFGWVIHTNLEDVTLRSSEQRLVSIGLEVWGPGRGRSSGVKPLTAKERRAIFAERNYQCTICGIAGGERYPDSPEISAVLSIVREIVAHSHGSQTTDYSVQCRRCQAGGSNHAVNVEELLQQVWELDEQDKAVFIRWAESGRQSALDGAWARFRQLSRVVQAEIYNLLRGD
jgi:hypothetical protein